jgi:hypothetical protein
VVFPARDRQLVRSRQIIRPRPAKKHQMEGRRLLATVIAKVTYVHVSGLSCGLFDIVSNFTTVDSLTRGHESAVRFPQ